MNALHDQKGTPDLKQGMSRSLVRFLTITVVSLIAIGGTWGSAVWEYRTLVNLFRERGDPTTIEEVVTSYTVPVGIADSTEQWSKVQEVLESADLASSGEGVPLLCRDLSNYRFPEPGQPCEFLEISEQFLRRIDPVIQAIREASAIRGQARLPTEIHPLKAYSLSSPTFSETPGACWKSMHLWLAIAMIRIESSWISRTYSP